MSNTARKPIKSAAQALPHSWGFEDWPEGVWPGKARARYVVRANRRALHAHGALSRPGREIVILGHGYATWLASQASRVDGYTIAPNSQVEAAAA